MGAKYTSQSTSGYNASPPADDGSQTASNLITWAGIKSKLADVLKTFGEAINTALVATLNLSARAVSSNDSGVAGDHWRTIQLSGGATYTLPDAATVGVGWVVSVVNVGTSIGLIARTTSGDFINGVATNLSLSPGDAITLKVNAAGNGFITDSARSVDIATVQGRLTLSSGTPVTSTDVTSATTVYFTPFSGNKIALFDGTGTWNDISFTEKSLSVPAAANTVYDVFAYNDAGTVSIEATAWTNISSRATALVLQNGVLVKSGSTTRRYLGSFGTTSIAGQVEDSLAKRFLWNYYNRVERPMQALEATNSWSHTNTFHQANASSANQLEYVQGVSDEPVEAEVNGLFSSSEAANSINAGVGIGIDSSTVSSAQQMDRITNTAGARQDVRAKYRGYPGLGRRTLRWLEQSTAAGTTTWYGDNGQPSEGQCGIIGKILA